MIILLSTLEHTQNMLASKKIKLANFILFQLSLILTGSLLFMFFLGYTQMESFLAGSLTMFVGNFILLSRFLLKKQNFQPAKELMILYGCSFLKMMIIIAGTILVALYLQPSFTIYLGGLFLLQVAIWMMPLFLK
ncbi:hypothetical protein OAO18_04515 [Francisellaceae bacterium]|nr:hypothetical protein [Francisellaceae bacterium]